MRIPLLAGRYFDGRDGEKEQKTIIVNQSLAHRLWSDQDPIGKMVALNFNLGDFRVVGVVADVRHSSLEESGGYEMYLGYRQIGIWAIDMVVRSVRPPKSLVPDVRAALLAYDPDLPSGESLELDHLVDDAVAPRRLITQLLGFFSALALALAALGLYGVISYSVGQRVQEIGIRMAVGAQRRDILDLILRGGMKLIFVGVLTGIVGALALGKVLQSMLFGVTGHDPLVFAADAALLGLVGVIACIVPAMRATRVDPMTALRAE
jgi:predicted permease